MKIDIGEKYVYIYDDLNNNLAYFENFESKDKKNKMIAISIENNKGERFLNKNNNLIQDAKVVWFGSRKLKYKVIFKKERGLSFIILFSPSSLKFK